MRFALLFLLLSLPLVAAPPTDVAPSLPALISSVTSRDDATQKALRSMQYQQVTHIEQLGDKDQVTHQQTLQMIVRPGASPEIRVVSAKGDHLPSDPDEAKQQTQGQEIERRKHTLLLKDLVTRFNVSFAGTGDCFGQKAYILAFEPKPGQPYRDQTEKVLNQLHGRMWVRASDSVILKTEATLAHPVAVAWIFARISQLDFHYELRTATNDFDPAWLQVLVQVDAPFVTVRQRQTVDMTHFESRGRLAMAGIPSL